MATHETERNNPLEARASAEEAATGVVSVEPDVVENRGDSNYQWKVLGCVVFGTFMVILDSTAVNVALPTLQKVFASGGQRATVDQVDGVLTAYILALGIVTPLADLHWQRLAGSQYLGTGAPDHSYLVSGSDADSGGAAWPSASCCKRH